MTGTTQQQTPSKIIRATAWNNGHRGPGGYALRISKAFLNYFSQGSKVQLDLPNGVVTQANLTASFATTCPELRSAEIGRWLLSSGLAPWPERKPPKLRLQQMKKDHFKVL